MPHAGSCRLLLRGASGLATANYLGYWLGALACALQPSHAREQRPAEGERDRGAGDEVDAEQLGARLDAHDFDVVTDEGDGGVKLAAYLSEQKFI